MSYRLPLLILVLLSAHGLHAVDQPAPESSPIPAGEIGAYAQKQYEGDGIALPPTAAGAELRCVFQKLEGRIDASGLTLRSTAESAHQNPSLQLVARAYGRGEQLRQLPMTGLVEVKDGLARFVRPGLVEEYSVSMDGVRQDFLIAESRAGDGQLLVQLGITGATAHAVGDGVCLTLASGRKLTYSRLLVSDAIGRALEARLRVDGPQKLSVCVDDREATYPLRIDPTFSDADWFSMGAVPGVKGTVNAMVKDGSGNIYIGGDFEVVGDTTAANVAKWDGNTWTALGDGVTGGSVEALVVSGSTLYVGGSLTAAGGVIANRIAKWDGNAWSRLGFGLNSSVAALAISGADLYVGGAFTFAGPTPVSRIAKWDGSGWSALGSGLNGAANTLAASAGNIYVGGSFTTAGGGSANRIAVWSGSSWSALGSGLNDVTEVIAIDGMDVYAGGKFTTAGGTSAEAIAKWNGSTWSAVGLLLGRSPFIPATVNSIVFSGGMIYAAGDIYKTGTGSLVGNVAEWDGSSWSALDTGTDSPVSALVFDSQGDLYAGGAFARAGGAAALGLAKWNGAAWSSLNTGTDGRVLALHLVEGELHAGGDFTTVAGVAASRIAKWNGSNWVSLAGGVKTRVHAILSMGGSVYAGSEFDPALGAAGIDEWDGSTWSPLGGGVNSGVYALAEFDGDLYAGGTFGTAGGISVDNIARWDGSNWHPLDGGTDGQVTAFAVLGGNLYVGGYFANAGSVLSRGIARWDGQAWAAIGSGVSNGALVTSLAVSGNDLFVGGLFSSASGVSALNIAMWNGTAWSALANGVGVYEDADYVTSLAVHGGDLFVGGKFVSASGVSAPRIARWDGSSWEGLGSGTSDVVEALAVSGTDLFVGGDFGRAGDKASGFLARVVVPSLPPTADAGGPYTTNEGTSLVLDGSGSADDVGIVSYAWDLDNDGQYDDDAGVTVTHVFPNSGGYTVSLRVTDLHANTAIDSAAVTVNNVAPTAAAGGPYSANEGSSITFDASGSSDPGNDIVLYEWDWENDGSYDATGASATYTFASNGNHTVGLRVTDADSATATATTSVTVVNVAPTANAGGPYSGNEGSSISFDASGSSDPGDDIVLYEWDWDNNGTYDATGVTASHSFVASGTYTVGLRVTDANAATDTDSATVTVNNVAPNADAGGPYSGNEGSSISFDASASSDPGNDIVLYEWDWDNNGTYDATGVAASHSFSSGGSQTVVLRVTDADNATSTDTAIVTVNGRPVAIISGPTMVNEGGSITLDGSNSTDDTAVTGYAWDLDNDGQYDDATSVSVNPSFPDSGSATIGLQVTDAGGLTGVTGFVITVNNVAPTANAGGPLQRQRRQQHRLRCQRQQRPR